MTVRLTIRLPSTVHEKLRHVVFKNGNSLNQEMVMRIIQHEELLKKIETLEAKQYMLDAEGYNDF